MYTISWTECSFFILLVRWALRNSRTAVWAFLTSPVDSVYIKICLGTLFFYYFAATVRSFILKGLLSYHGWIFDSPRRQSLQTKIWFILMKIFTFRNPKLDAFQGKFSFHRDLMEVPKFHRRDLGLSSRPPIHHLYLRLSTKAACPKAEWFCDEIRQFLERD